MSRNECSENRHLLPQLFSLSGRQDATYRETKKNLEEAEDTCPYASAMTFIIPKA